jgi:hypothetical protein
VITAPFVAVSTAVLNCAHVSASAGAAANSAPATAAVAMAGRRTPIDRP